MNLTRDGLYQYIDARQNVSLAEIHKNFDGTDGDLWMLHPKNTHIVIWGGMSDKFFDVLTDLWQSKKIYVHGCHWLVYLCDGMVPNIPVLKRTPPQKNDRWLPVVFCTYPSEDERKRKME